MSLHWENASSLILRSLHAPAPREIYSPPVSTHAYDTFPLPTPRPCSTSSPRSPSWKAANSIYAVPTEVSLPRCQTGLHARRPLLR